MNEPEALSLTDLGPQRELIPIGDKKLAVYGISAEGVLALFQRFPELKAWVQAGKITAANLKETAPHALTAIIATGCGQPGDEAAEAVARKLPIETQLDVIEAIGRLTFPAGFGPFVKRIVAFTDQARSAASPGKGLDTILQPTSNPSPPSGEAPTPS